MLYSMILIFTIFYAILAWRRLDLATAFLIMVLPVYQIRFQMGFLPSTLLEVMIITLFVVWFVKTRQAEELPLFNRKLRNVRHYPFYCEIVALLLIAFIAAAVAGFSNASLGILKAYFMEPIMFFVVFVNVFKVRENRDKVFWALAISALVISLVAIYQKITGHLMPLEYIDSGRVTGVFNYPNALGLYLGPIFMLLSGWLISNIQYLISNKKILDIRYWILKNLFLLVIILLSLISIYFAKSEGALVGVAAGLFIFGLLYNKWSRWAIVGIAVLVVAGIAINSTARDYAISKIMLRDLDGQIRRQVWKESWLMISDNRLITGAGLANYQKTVAPYHQDGIFVRDYDDPDWRRKVVWDDEYKAQVWQPVEIYLYPHNIFLNFWSELGLFGMLVFVWIIIKFIIISLHLLKILNIKYLILGLLCAMVVIVVHGLVDVPYFKNDLAVLFWMLVGMIGVMNLQVNSK